MNVKNIYLISLLAVLVTSSCIMVTSQEDNNASPSSNNLKNITNNLILINKSLDDNNNTSSTNGINLDAHQNSSNLVINATNKTAFMIGNGLADNESTCKIGGLIKPRAYPSKMWYVVQGVPHGYV